MKKLCLYLLLSITLFACSKDEEIPEKIFPGNVIIRTQEGVDNFAKRKYTAIDGYLVIGDRLSVSNPSPTPSDITDLSGLSTLTNILDQLEIQGNPMLTSLRGLDNITSIGSLFLYDNDLLETLDDLEGLRTITNRPVLKDDNNSSSGTISIYSNPNLKSIEILGNLTSDTIDFVPIVNNPNLISLNGLESLTNVPGGLQVNTCNLLTSLDGLQNIESLGSLVLSNNLNLSSLAELNNIKEGLYSLIIRNNSSLQSLEGLENITEVPRLFEISWNSALTSLDGLRGLLRIGNAVPGPNTVFVSNNKFTLIGNTALTSLSGLNNLTLVEGELTISRNPQLTNFCALGSPFQNNTIFDTFNISSNLFNPSLQDILDGNCTP